VVIDWKMLFLDKQHLPVNALPTALEFLPDGHEFAPVAPTFADLSLSNREISIGGGYELGKWASDAGRKWMLDSGCRSVGRGCSATS